MRIWYVMRMRRRRKSRKLVMNKMLWSKLMGRMARSKRKVKVVSCYWPSWA